MKDRQAVLVVVTGQISSDGKRKHGKLAESANVGCAEVLHFVEGCVNDEGVVVDGDGEVWVNPGIEARGRLILVIGHG